MKRQLELFTAIGVILLLVTTSARAQSSDIVFSDDFSQGLDKWQAVKSDDQNWSVVDGRATAHIKPSFTTSELVPKDEYWSNDWQNIEYRVELTPQTGVDRNIVFGWVDANNWYEVHFNQESFQIAHVKNKNVVWSSGYSFYMVNTQTYQLRVRFEAGLIEFWINDHKVFSERDEYYFQAGPGKIGLKASTGAIFPTQLSFDNVEVRLLPSLTTTATVPLFKQHDALWKNDEYDTALSWSDQPTIQRWGCALSSLAMIMKYYRLTTLLDGQPLNPATLNAWLKTQPDGYIGSGAINWLAGTRLTRLLSERDGTPKLEYRRHSGADLNVARSELQKKQPVIFEIPGHFLVGTGVTDMLTDFFINDPAYTYSLLSQHKVAPISTRTFQPSFTDLSYFLAAHSPELNVALFDQAAQPLSFDTFTESITGFPFSDQHTTPLVVQRHVAKPDTGEYRVEISRSELGTFSLELYLYDQSANPTIFKKAGWVGTTPIQLQISFQKDGPTMIKENLSWVSLREILKTLHDRKHITKTQTFLKLDRLAAAAAAAPLPHQLRHWSQLYTLATQSQLHFTPTAYSYLLQELETLKTTLPP